MIKIEKIIITQYKYQDNDKKTENQEPEKIKIIVDKKEITAIKKLLSKINSKGNIWKDWIIKERISVYILLKNNKYCVLEIENSRLARVGGYSSDNRKEEKELVETFRKILKK